ncbi:MAG: NUDIX hydrolase [Proteobacteria bacterium]|nr:NUDIX hydrolase [Pseudomonadota bacterium]
MNFCSNCGAAIQRCIPKDDDRPRFVCDVCHTVHYQNPKTVVGCIPECGGRILLCRRAIEPRAGYWTLPAGYLENGESVTEAARREVLEETRSRVEVRDLYTVFTLLHWNQIYMIFRAALLDQDFGPTRESSEVGLFDLLDIPWGELAFETISETLRHYVSDRAEGFFFLRVGTIPANRPPRRTAVHSIGGTI